MEDFWILSSESEKVVIAEAKTCARGLRRKHIYSLFNHRANNKYDKDFPALLIVNAHSNAGSWKEKLRPIDPQHCECASENNILIVRIEDLLFFWNSMVEERNSKETLLSAIYNENGRMEVQKNGKIDIHR